MLYECAQVVSVVIVIGLISLACQEAIWKRYLK